MELIQVPKGVDIDRFEIRDGKLFANWEEFTHVVAMYKGASINKANNDPLVKIYGESNGFTAYFSSFRNYFSDINSLLEYLRQNLDQLPNFARVENPTSGNTENPSFGELKDAINKGFGETVV